MKADEVISRVADLCREHGAKKVILYGSRAKGTAGERSDIDIAVSGGADFDELLEKVEELPTLYSVDLLNMDTCRNDLLMEDIKQYLTDGFNHFAIRWMLWRRPGKEILRIPLY